MHHIHKIEIRRIVVALFVLLNAIILKQAFISHHEWYRLLFITLPLLILIVLFFYKGIFKKKTRKLTGQ